MSAFRSGFCLATAVLVVALTAASPAQTETGFPPDTRFRDTAVQDLERIDELLYDGNYSDAEDAARQALNGLKDAEQERTLAASWYADRLVEALLRSGKGTREETLDHARLAVAIKEVELGADDIETGRSLDRLGRVLTRTASFAEASRVLTRSFDIAQQARTDLRVEQASTRRSLGQLLCKQGLYAAGHAQLSAALELEESARGESSTGTAMTLLSLGECLGEQRDPAGKGYLREALRRMELTFGEDHPAVADTLTSLGFLLTLDGRFSEARASLERALAIYDRAFGADSAKSSAPLTRLGRLLAEVGEYSAAREAFERALAIRTREYGPLDRETLDTLFEKGGMLMRIGDFEGADRTLETVVSGREKLLGPNHALLADALQLQGITLFFLGGDADPRTAAKVEPLMSRALAIRIDSLGPRSLAVANSLMNMANLLYEPAGKYEQALSFGQRSLEILESMPQPSEYDIFHCLYTLTLASRGMGDLPAALEYSRRAVVIRERVLGAMHPHSVGILGIRAQLLAEAGDYQAMATVLLQMDRISREHLELVARTATEDEALQYAYSMAHGWDLLVTFAGHQQEGASLVNVAWDDVMRGRGLILNELMTRRKINLQAKNPELARLRDEVNSANQHLSKLIVAGPKQSGPEEFNAMVSAARTRKERAERAFAETSAEHLGTYTLGRAELSDVIGTLSPDTALVAFVKYVHYESAGPRKPVDTGVLSYAAFVVQPPEKSARVIHLGGAEAIERHVTRWRDAATFPAISVGRANAAEALYRAEAAELRKAVWDPIAKQLGSVGRVFIVPEGALHAVSFAALPTGDAQYLAETGPMLHYLSSERDVLRAPPAPTRNGLLALGAPDFDGTELFAALRSEPIRLAMVGGGTMGAVYRGPRSACGSFQDMTFEPLPAASREVAEVLNLWRGAGDDDDAIVLSGAEASETAFKQLAAGKRVLHLATHGFFLGGRCGSALDPQEGDAITNENPLLLSGLVLAGANHRAAAGPDEDDGILTAEEIATLDLGDTEWAVLSACDTGSGEIRAGEGVFGLQRAFRLAGARTTIMSLWPVEDEAARQWMTTLYRKHFAEGRSTADSVHGATLELLAQRRAAGLSTHPFYWAGFVASGDWR